jgi:biopolymer transport protein ExbD
MPIHVPGKRAANGKKAAPTSRDAVAVLQLTAMVDMFTVLVVFLLQNWATTQQILPLPEAVELPSAGSTKELKPSNVVILTNKDVRLNSETVTNFLAVKEQEDWMVEPLKQKIEALIAEGERKKLSVKNQVQKAVIEAKEGEPTEEVVDDFRKITIQADKNIDFLTVKKIMYTVTEAGVYEINFAVVKTEKKEAASM